MGNKESILKRICINQYGQGKHKKPQKKDYIKNGFSSIIELVFFELGGKLGNLSTNCGKYDIDLQNFIIEFDEENHFNRYRLITLTSDYYKSNGNFNKKEYINFCKIYEKKCCTYSGFLKNGSTEKQFTATNSIQGIKGSNYTRWKQRAFYDFIKDISASIIGIPIIRISIYEIYKDQSIEHLINNNEEKLLIEYIEYRLKSIV